MSSLFGGYECSKPDQGTGSVTAFEIVPLETVSEASSNASIGDLNADGHPDIVLVKGRHWQLQSKVLLGDGKGHFAPGPRLPSNAMKSYSGSLADMATSGRLDIVLSNDAPDPKLVLVNDGMGHFRVEPTVIVGYVDAPGVIYYNNGTGRSFEAHPFGDGKGTIYGMASGDLDGDGRLDLVAAMSDAPSFILFNRGSK